MTTTIILIVVVVIAFMPLYNIAERNNIAISIVCGIALIEMIVMGLYYCTVSIIVTRRLKGSLIIIESPCPISTKVTSPLNGK